MSPQTVSFPASLQDGDRPLVSVIVPTYSDSEYLLTVLKSITDQIHGNIELAVMDRWAWDGSASVPRW